MANNFLLNHDIYKPLCLETAIKDYLPYCQVKTSIIDSKNTKVEVLVNEKYSENATQITNEFLNYVLDLSIKSSFNEGNNYA